MSKAAITLTIIDSANNYSTVFGVTPTATILSERTRYSVRRIKSLTAEGVTWQSKMNWQKERITRLKKLKKDIKQIEIAEKLGLSVRQVYNIEKAF